MKSLVTRISGRNMIRHGHSYILAMEDIIPRPERIRLEKPRRMDIIQRLHRNRLRVLSLSRMGRQPVPVDTSVSEDYCFKSWDSKENYIRQGQALHNQVLDNTHELDGNRSPIDNSIPSTRKWSD